jgi:hypothetical protein
VNLVAKVNKGEINLEALRNHVKTLKDGYYEIKIKKSRAIRSHNQNRYYWGIIIEELVIFFDGAVTKDQIHDILGYKFLTTRYEHPLTGDLIEKITSTTKLNTKQMEEYLERCRKYALEEYNHRIPLPNETIYNY